MAAAAPASGRVPIYPTLELSCIPKVRFMPSHRHIDFEVWVFMAWATLLCIFVDFTAWATLFGIFVDFMAWATPSYVLFVDFTAWATVFVIFVDFMAWATPLMHFC